MKGFVGEIEDMIYGPPEHADATVHATKADAMASKEHFCRTDDGVTVRSARPHPR